MPVSRDGKYNRAKKQEAHESSSSEEEDWESAADEEEEDEDEEEEYDLSDVLNDHTVGERKCLYALMGLTKEYRSLRQQYFDELAALELKNIEAEHNIAEKRRHIVAGLREPTAAEIAMGEKEMKKGEDESQEEAEVQTKEEEKPKPKADGDEDDEDDQGIPNFWLSTFKNSDFLDQKILGRDAQVLSYLRDIRMTFVNNKFYEGFTLSFHFAPNDFFEHQVLQKTFLVEGDGEDLDLFGDDVDTTALEHIYGSESTDIQWNSLDKNVTIVVKEKKQTKKASKKGVAAQSRTIKVEEKLPSFFNFFDSPTHPDDEHDSEDSDDSGADEEEYEAYYDKLEEDLEVAATLRAGIICRPAQYFSGKHAEEVYKDSCEQLGMQALAISAEAEVGGDEEEKPAEGGDATARGEEGMSDAMASLLAGLK